MVQSESDEESHVQAETVRDEEDIKMVEEHQEETGKWWNHTDDILGVAKDRVDSFSCKHYLLSLVPIVSWLPRYKWKKDLPNDLVAGFTVAVMHIPQGMAYALLAGVDPVIGIYTAFFPVLLYFLLGTMPHASMGTFAVVCIMVSKPVFRLGQDEDIIEQKHLIRGAIEDKIKVEEDVENWSRLEVAVAVTFCVGVVQVSLGLARLGTLAILLTDCLVSGFTVGASIHVFTSQVKHILGIELPTESGIGRLIMTYNHLGQHLTMLNPVALIISVICILTLVLFDQILGPRLRKICRFPLPIQLVLVIIFTAISEPLKLMKVHKIKTIQNIGSIPLGLPSPSVPHPQIMLKIIPESITIAIVAFSIGQGLGNLFGAKYGYKVPPNQELIAQGSSNIFGSFFSCIPMSTSLSRSLVQERSGCRSNITSLTSAFLLLGVLLFLGPLFQPLPICVLAAIIIASLTGMFKKLSDMSLYWTRSPSEGLLWTITFLSTVFLDVDIGLMVGIVVSLILTLSSGSMPQVAVLKDEGVLLVRGPLNYLTVGMARWLAESKLRGAGFRRINETKSCSTRVEIGESEGLASEEELIEPPQLLLDLSNVTQLDREGAGIATWLAKYLSRSRGPWSRLGGVVVSPAHISLHSLSSGIPTYLDRQQFLDETKLVEDDSKHVL